MAVTSRAVFPHRVKVPTKLLSGGFPPAPYVRRLIGRHSDAVFEIEMVRFSITQQQWAKVTFSGKKVCLLFKGVSGTPEPLFPEPKSGRFGEGIYLSPDPLIAMAYTRSRVRA